MECSIRRGKLHVCLQRGLTSAKVGTLGPDDRRTGRRSTHDPMYQCERGDCSVRFFRNKMMFGSAKSWSAKLPKVSEANSLRSAKSLDLILCQPNVGILGGLPSRRRLGCFGNTPWGALLSPQFRRLRQRICKPRASRPGLSVPKQCSGRYYKAGAAL